MDHKKITDMMKKILVTVILLLALSSCQKDSLSDIIPGGGVADGSQVSLSFNVPRNEQITRATSTEFEEGRIMNIYVMAVYNSTDENNANNGLILERWTEDESGITYMGNSGDADTYEVDVQLSGVKAGDNVTLYAIANYGEYNAVMNLSKEALDGLKTEDDIEKLIVSMNEENKGIERGNNFLMTGIFENTIIANDGGIANDIVIDLKRVDSKIEINLSVTGFFEELGNDSSNDTYYIFYPGKWRVCNLPNSINLFEGAIESSAITGHFDSEWYNYEGIGSDLGKTFSFYILPQISRGGIEISQYDEVGDYVYDGFSDVMKGIVGTTYPHDLDNVSLPGFPPDGYSAIDYLQYCLREKREKIGTSIDGVHEPATLENGEFLYAPPSAPYIEMSGTFEYTDTRLMDNLDGNGTGETPRKFVVDATYTVHLGYVAKTGVKAVDNFDVENNKHYIYNLKVNSVDHIMVESVVGEHSFEDAPGVEGSVETPEIHFRVNSGHQTSVFAVKDSMIPDPDSDEKIYWAVSTPFGEATPGYLQDKNNDGEKDLNDADHSWIYFVVKSGAWDENSSHTFNYEGNGGAWYTLYDKYSSNSAFDQSEYSSINDPRYPSEYEFEGVDSKFDELLDDISGGNQSKYLNVKQYAEVLRENKRRSLSKKKNTKRISTSKNDHVLTAAFVDEYYYDYHPFDNTPASEMWNDFSNVVSRTFSITRDPHISEDAKSTYADNIISIEQMALQTYYERDLAGAVWPLDSPIYNNSGVDSQSSVIVYGVEGLAEYDAAGKYQVHYNYGNERNGNTSIENYANNWRSGLVNTQLMWIGNNGTLTEMLDWSIYQSSTFTNSSTKQGLQLQQGYEDGAAWECLKRNRDENGNGDIDINEIKWYIPSSTQLCYTWIGEGAMSIESRMYMNWDWSMYDTYIMSSTHVGDQNTWVMWANEGSSVGHLDVTYTKDRNKQAAVRCFRNLGSTLEQEKKNLTGMNGAYTENGKGESGDKGAAHEFVAASKKSVKSEKVTLKDGQDYTMNIYTLDLSNIDNTAYRRYTQKYELPAHHIFEDHNKPWGKFEVMSEPDTYGTNRENSMYGNFYNISQYLEDTDSENNPCPDGWRMPNQREISMMQMMLKTDEGWLEDLPTSAFTQFFLSRTYMQEVDASGNRNVENRRPVSVSVSNGSVADGFTTLMLQNHLNPEPANGAGEFLGNNSYVRCVRDAN